MQLINLCVLLASASFLAAPSQALPTAEAARVGSSPDVETHELIARATKTSIFCAGSKAGTSSGAYACVKVVWDSSKTKGSVTLTADDSRGDSNDAYGYFRVYWANGATQDSPKLRDSRGYAASSMISDQTRSYPKSGIIMTGVRVYACVDDAGTDTCTNKFVQSPYY